MLRGWRVVWMCRRKYFCVSYTQAVGVGRYVFMQSNQPSKCCSKAERYVTDQPTKAVATALGVGLLASLLPVGRIVGMLVDVGFSLTRPILLVAGICKLSECCRSQTQK